MSNSILIVEDEPTMQMLLRHILQRKGYETDIFNNGEEALTAVHKKEYTLIISDVLLPGIDGISLCKYVKEQPAISAIPFILLTSQAQKDEMKKGLDAGADLYMIKPFSVEELLSKIDEIVHTKRV